MITVERAGADDLVIDLGRGVPTAMGCDFAVRAPDGNQLGPDGWGKAGHLFTPKGVIKGERTRLVIPAGPFAALNPGERLTLEIPAASYRSAFVWPALPAPTSVAPRVLSDAPRPPEEAPPRRVDVLAPPPASFARPGQIPLAAAVAVGVIVAGALGFWAMRLSSNAALIEQERQANAAKLVELSGATAALSAQSNQLASQRREIASMQAQLARERHEFERLRQNAGAEFRALESDKRALAAEKEQFEKTRLEFLDERVKWRQERDASPREAAAAAPLPSPASAPSTVVAIAVDSIGRWEIGQQPSAFEARQEAMRRCTYRGSGCQVSDLQACVAFSRSARGWSYAFGATIDEARRLAAARCNQSFGACAVLRDDEYCR